jgi:hypothetical protein
MALGSVRGIIVGVQASPLLLVVTGGGVGSSDGSGGAIIIVLPILGALIGLLSGLAIALLWRIWKAADGWSDCPWSLILAVIAAAAPVINGALLFARWCIEYWTVVGCYSGLCTAVLALLCAFPGAKKLAGQSAPALSHRRLGVRLALTALVLNGAALAWLFMGPPLPPASRQGGKARYTPSATMRTPPNGLAGPQAAQPPS